MSKLDEVVQVFCDTKRDVFNKNAVPEDVEELQKLMKNKIKQQIGDEIKEEKIKEITAEAEEKINRSEETKMIEEAKSLLWNGFVMAFVVGLLVNQVTDVISFYKQGSVLESISATVWICIILGLICFGMYIYVFADKVFKIIKNRTRIKVSSDTDILIG